MGRSIPKHLIGKRVGNDRIELISLLGEGSYGTVYRALLHRGGPKKPKQCAVKVLRTDLGERGLLCRQRRELELHKRVSDGNGIVTLYESFKEGNYQYLVMKFCPDRDLCYGINKKRFRGNDTLIKDVFTQVLDAVEYCHSQSVFHRDIKPENILLYEDGHKALLSDFGLATSDHVSTETRTGSPAYMSPECWGAFSSSCDRPYATAPSDIWSLGILLVNISCGRQVPWTFANPSDRFFSDFIKHPALLRLFLPLSPEVHDILARMFTVQPEKRIFIKDLKVAIQSVKHFGIPSAHLVEYHNYQRAVWKATFIVPTPPRPLALRTPQNIRYITTRPSFGARVDKVKSSEAVKNVRFVSSVMGSPAFHARHNRINTTASSRGARLYPCTPPQLPSPLSSSSSADSGGPATPEMCAINPDVGIPEINIIDQLPDEMHDIAGITPLKVTFAPSVTPKMVLGESHTPPESWQSILKALNAW